MTRNNQD